ncbi:hypothetical protein [Streptacidiphilus neutrinimicus]|uniref:hypothetical protein n=1 Tax=Streptacidiphilus neutrinimicus TaxID=105420 RepID=UPI0005A7DEE1|nr:hypothetical protein [Streptacidiphilus neutrinimicus]
MHTHRRSRPRVLGALAVLVAGAAGLTACASSSTASSGPASVVSGSPSGASSSPSGGITPGGPIKNPSPSPSAPGTGVKPSPPKPAHGIPISGYNVQGTVLTVYFFAGVCDKHGVTADQSQSGEVRATVVVTQHAPTGQMCPLVETQQHASVDLGRPLDDRKVVDTSTGLSVAPQKAGLPMGAG